MLKHHSQRLPSKRTKPIGIESCDIRSFNHHLSPRRVMKAIYTPEKGTFPAPRKPHNDKNLAFLYGKRDIAKRDELSCFLKNGLLSVSLIYIRKSRRGIVSKNFGYVVRLNTFLGRHISGSRMVKAPPRSRREGDALYQTRTKASRNQPCLGCCRCSLRQFVPDLALPRLTGKSSRFACWPVHGSY